MENPVTAKFCNECGFDLHEIRQIIENQKETGEVPQPAAGFSVLMKKEDPKKPYIRTTSPLPQDTVPASAQFQAPIQQVPDRGTAPLPVTAQPGSFSPPARLPESRPAPVPDRIRNPSLAAALSLLPGLGQVYNGMLARGIVLFIATLIGLFVWVIPGVCIWIYCIYDAYSIAGKINRGEIPFGPRKN